MKDAFGGPFQLIDDTQNPGTEPVAYAGWVRQSLADVRLGTPGILRIRRPRPTAAYSTQDTAHPKYEMAKEQSRAFGFTPIERGTGGRLSIFDEGALGVTLIAPHANPHGFMHKRFDLFAGAIANALASLGIDARIGELPNEYCPGKYSINASGRTKLVGIAQRMNKHGYQMGAVIAVHRSEAACAAIAEAYRTMEMPFDAATYGGINDVLSGVAFADVSAKVLSTLVEQLGA